MGGGKELPGCNDSSGPETLTPSDKRITVVMASDELGQEHFHYDSLDEALAAIQRLVRRSEAENDGIERLIGVLVNSRSSSDARAEL